MQWIAAQGVRLSTGHPDIGAGKREVWKPQSRGREVAIYPTVTPVTTLSHRCREGGISLKGPGARSSDSRQDGPTSRCSLDWQGDINDQRYVVANPLPVLVSADFDAIGV